MRDVRRRRRRLDSASSRLPAPEAPVRVHHENVLRRAGRLVGGIVAGLAAAPLLLTFVFSTRAVAGGAVVGHVDVPRVGMAVAAHEATGRVFAATRGPWLAVAPSGTYSVERRIDLGWPARALGVDQRRGIVYAAGGPPGYRPPPGSLWAIDARTNRLLWDARVGRVPVAVAAHPSSDLVYVANFRTEDVSVVRRGSVVRTVTLPGHPVNLAVHPYDGRVFVTTEEGRLHVLAPGGEPLRDRRVVSSTNWPDVVVDAGRDRVLVTEPSRKRVVVLDAETLRLLQVVDLAPEEPWDLAIASARGRLFVRTDPGFASKDSGTVTVIDVPTLDVVDSVEAGAGGTDVAVDARRYRGYVTNSFSAGVTVLSEDAVPPEAGLDPVAPLLAPGSSIGGRVTDDYSGVRKLVVRYAGASSEISARAQLDCATRRRLDCAWTVPAPGAPGLYAVTIEAVDRAGSSAAGPEAVVVRAP